jgi:chemotaxis protein CheC
MEEMNALTSRQLDALREVVNIGAGHAATALSEMTGQTVMISVPSLTVCSVGEVPHRVAAGEEPVAAVQMGMSGDLTGVTALIVPHDSALRVAELMVRRPAGSFTTIGAFEQSAIQEAGNILGSAFLNALAEFMGMILLPTPPTFAVASTQEVLAESTRATREAGADVFVIDTEFYLRERQEPLHGFFFLLPDPASLGHILRAVRVG